MAASSLRNERTIARPVDLRGVSLLAGLDVRVRFLPAEEGNGVVFRRTDLVDRPTIPASIAHVVPRQRRTAIQSGGAVVEMVEHIMAALAGLHVDNCTVEIDGPETPGLGGSSLGFVEALKAAEIVEQSRRRECLVIDHPITVREGNSLLTAHPGVDAGLVLSYQLDYGADSPIRRQSHFLSITPESFATELASSRTFLLDTEAEALRRAGIGKHVTERDLLIFGPDGPIDNSLRHDNECARHKMLDMVGDLALLGKDLVGHVVAHRSGHSLNAALVQALLKASRGHAEPRDRNSPALDANAIMKILPHRYPFLLIDRVIELEDDRVVALKNVSSNEPFFQGHWPGRPIMPGVLILESIAQAAGVMIARQTDCRCQYGYIATIDDVKLRRPVVPGDQLRLEVQCLRKRPRTKDVKGIARVGGQIVAEARIRFMIADHDERVHIAPERNSELTLTHSI
jgi:UDP-3-O-[3-hydroxymyristoyl] N-acetylglucosamine deacetylase/3-hydroxyacyl-[acyl-carrier-protein] dehydratase